MAIASQLEQAEDNIRFNINDDAVAAKYSPLRVITQLGKAWNKGLEDVNSALSPASRLYLTYDLAVNTTSLEYQLPAACVNVVELALLSSSGVTPAQAPFAYIPSFHQNDIKGFNWRLVGGWLVFDYAFTVATTIRITYIPSALDYLHVGVMTQTAFDTAALSTFKLDTTPTLGFFDPRPNSYVGACFRLHTGPTPTGYSVFPWQERWITAYNMANAGSTALVTLNKPFDVDFSAVTGDYGYEIVPLPYQELMTLAEIEAARSICGPEGRGERASALRGEYAVQLVEARRKLGNTNRVAQQSPPARIDQKRVGSGGMGMLTRRVLPPP